MNYLSGQNTALLKPVRVCMNFVVRITVVAAFAAAFCCAAGCTGRGGSKGDIDAPGKYHAVYGNAVDLYRHGHTKEASHYLDSTYAVYAPLPPIAQYLQYTFAEWVHFDNRRFDSANLYADSALHLLQQSGISSQYPDDYIHALLEKGHVLMALQQNELAYDYYLKARDFAEENEHTRNVHELSYDIGMTLYRQGRYADAANSFKTGFAEARVLLNSKGLMQSWANPIYRMQEMLANTGLCYTKTKQFDSALYYYNKALAFIDSNIKHIQSPAFADAARGVVYGNMGTTYLQMGDSTKARELYRQSIALNVKPGGDRTDALKNAIKLSAIDLDDNEVAYVKQLLDQAHRDGTTNLRPDIERDYAHLMSLYYDNNGNNALANEYYRHYISLRDSIVNATQVKNNTDIRNYLAYKEQQHRIELLERDNRVGRILNYAVLLFCFLILAVVALAIRGYRRSRRNVAALATLNQQIEEQKTLLEQKNREKDRLLNAVAHDLRNPIGSIVFLTEQLNTDDTPLIPVETVMEMVGSSANTALALINELNEFSPEAPYIAARAFTNINTLVKECVHMFGFRAAEKHQQLTCYLPEHEVNAMVDGGKIKRVLINLIGNAIKFTNPDGKISVMLLENSQEVVIEVSDNGIGIPQKMVPNLFDMFTPSRRNGTGGERSYGLGLSICMQIVRGHNGTLTVDSAEGHGSTFCVRLPKV